MISASQLKAKAMSRQLEVEDLLKTVRTQEPFLGQELLQLADDLEWGYDSGAGTPGPLKNWAESVAAYHKAGCPGVIRYSIAQEDGRNAYFALAVLEHVRTAEAVSAILEIARFWSASRTAGLSTAIQAASRLNLMLSFSPSPALTADLEREVREFLHQLLSKEPMLEHEHATAVLALRGVGDATSLSLVSGLEFAYPWDDTVGATKSAIKKRLRHE